MNMLQIPVRDRIEERMEAVSRCGGVVGTVDRVEGEAVRLARHADGLHHYIPLSWVVEVDDKVYLDKDVNQCTSGWRPDAASCGG